MKRISFLVASLTLASSAMLSGCSSEIGKVESDFVDGCSQSGGSSAVAVCQCAFDKLVDHYGKKTIIAMNRNGVAPPDFGKVLAQSAMQCRRK